MIGYALCGSFCTHRKSLEILEKLIDSGYEVQPIVSETVFSTDTRFGKAQDLIEQLGKLCGREVIHTIKGAEPLGPKSPLEALVIAPCTGNTLAKMALGITDTAVCMAAKAHLRSDRTLLVAPASNDALSANLKNIGELLTRKHVYFVPMIQDDPTNKPHSLVAQFDLIPQALEMAMAGRSMERLFR